MGDDGGPPAREPPIRVETFYESDRTRISRVFRPDGTVIRKEPLGPGWQARLRHERTMLAKLRGVVGVTQLADTPAQPTAIMLDDLAGPTLADIRKPCPADQLLRIAVDLARAVAGMHSRGVMHRDVAPANIVMSGPDSRPVLIDFALASSVAEVRPEFLHHTKIVGTLPYLAPEQTGRTGRPVDARSDLYALGATLYELATGAPPFGVGDALRLTHDQLARVPVAPAQLNPGVPRQLSEIIMHLLEKEPDRRYQTADGLIRDLTDPSDGPVGARDFPARLLPPSQLVGREAEVGALAQAFADALAGQERPVLIAGAAGMGKSSLIDELRPIVAGADGWFVTGKFDQYRRDPDYDGISQGFRSLGRLLLAEPEEELAAIRARIRRAIGPNAGLIAAGAPEFSLVLDEPAAPGDPLTIGPRSLRAAVDLLRAVASPQRPLAFVADDVQWAGRSPLGFLDMLLDEPDHAGLLVVAAYRDEGAEDNQALSTSLKRWARRPGGVQHIQLGALPPADQARMIADMLRIDLESAQGLARALAPHAAGNPYDIVELLNALRHNGVLRPVEGRWRWDDAVLARYLADADVETLLAARAVGLPPSSKHMLQAMAVLGSRVELALLQAATGTSAAAVDERLTPALNEGLLIAEPGAREAVRFRHDRVRETMLRSLDAPGLRELELSIARRLAPIPEWFTVGAQQYLPVIDAIDDDAERAAVGDLMRRAADRATVVSNFPLAERLLAGALRLADPDSRESLLELHTERLAVLYSMGRLDEADEEYAAADRLARDRHERSRATLIQISSLGHRKRNAQALEIGLDLLSQHGATVPPPELRPAAVEQGFAMLHRWLDHTDPVDDLERPELTDPDLLVTGSLIRQLLPIAYFTDQTGALLPWLAFEALRIIIDHGPGRTLIGPASVLPVPAIAQRGDYVTGYRAARRVLALGEARGYEPGVSEARHEYAIGAQWHEPLEATISQERRARVGLIHAGDLMFAGFTYLLTIPQLFEVTPKLSDYAGDVDVALSFARQTGTEHLVEALGAYRWLADALQGEQGRSEVGSKVSADRYARNSVAAVHTDLTLAIVAAIFGDADALDRHTAPVMSRLEAVVATYPMATAHLLRALALANAARKAPDPDTFAELDRVIDWLAARAADGPANFLHLLRLVEAERSWATGDRWGALQTYDAAQREASARPRPWHRALILERAAQFHFAEGMEHTAYRLLADARAEYVALGATAKVEDLDWVYPDLQAATAKDAVGGSWSHRRSTIMTGSINMLGVLSATQAISSQTTIEGLRSRVVEVLSAMTGATGVHLLIYSEDRGEWWVPGQDDAGNEMTPVAEAGRAQLIPLSVFRYAMRIREPLVIDDAVRDDRFARDPYFAGAKCCSMLAVPIINRGQLQALLLLENRLIRSAFAAERLEGLMLIASQLAVSLDNAMVYASLERKVAARTDELALANAALEQLSITDPLTGLANRRRLEEVLTSQWQDAQRATRSLALAMVDIDHFKLYNDHYGHAAGDRCLQRVAKALNASARDGDLIARYGGEEFAVVMPGIDIVEGARIAERLRTAIADIAEPHMLTSDRIVTVSIGVSAILPTDGATSEALVESADVELYRAKRSGRNQVRAASP